MQVCGKALSNTCESLLVNPRSIRTWKPERSLTERETAETNSVHARALGMAANSIDFLKLAQSHGSSNSKLASDLFRRWFKDIELLGVVLRAMIKIYSAMQNDPIVFFKCTHGDVVAGFDFSTLFAFTVSGDGDTSTGMYLGPMFWQANVDSGLDTKSGTIIHEMSHAVVGFEDHAYGKAARELDAHLCAKNADSIEYFCEEAWALRSELLHIHPRSFTLSGTWQEITVREVPGFLVVSDVYEITQVGEELAFASKLGFRVRGSYTRAGVNYADSANSMKCKVISENLMQGTFSASGISGTVWLTRVMVPLVGAAGTKLHEPKLR